MKEKNNSKGKLFENKMKKRKKMNRRRWRLKLSELSSSTHQLFITPLGLPIKYVQPNMDIFAKNWHIYFSFLKNENVHTVYKNV